jgi:hypothetical protein
MPAWFAPAAWHLTGAQKNFIFLLTLPLRHGL